MPAATAALLTVGGVRPLDAQRVEVGGVGLPQPRRDQRVLDRARHAVDALADRAQPFGPVEHRVHRGDVREQRLRGADVRGRLLAADVLLARLQRHAIRAMAAGVDRHADDAPRRLAHERLARREERGVRAAVAERHAEALRVADHRVGAHLAGRRQQRQRHQVARDRHEQAGGVGLLDDRPQVARPRRDRPDTAAGGRRRCSIGSVSGSPISSRMPSGSARPFRTSMVCGNVRADTRNTALLPRRRLLRIQPVEHRHRLGRGGAFVEQRRRRDLHPREVA